MFQLCSYWRCICNYKFGDLVGNQAYNKLECIDKFNLLDQNTVRQNCNLKVLGFCICIHKLGIRLRVVSINMRYFLDINKHKMNNCKSHYWHNLVYKHHFQRFQNQVHQLLHQDLCFELLLSGCQVHKRDKLLSDPVDIYNQLQHQCHQDKHNKYCQLLFEGHLPQSMQSKIKFQMLLLWQFHQPKSNLDYNLWGLDH